MCGGEGGGEGDKVCTSGLSMPILKATVATTMTWGGVGEGRRERIIERGYGGGGSMREGRREGM